MLGSAIDCGIGASNGLDVDGLGSAVGLILFVV
jgi:hypothetical protein